MQKFALMAAVAVAALMAMPGILFAPTTYLWVSATITTVLGIVIIILCLWRERQSVLA